MLPLAAPAAASIRPASSDDRVLPLSLVIPIAYEVLKSRISKNDDFHGTAVSGVQLFLSDVRTDMVQDS
jgi:hypothetical protein